MEMTERVKELMQGYLEKNCIELVEITYKREQGGMALRLLVDTPEGVTIKECEKLNDYLSELLDKNSLIDEHYVLDVSSPGLDRPITSDRDYERSMGKIIDITTYQMIDGKKAYEGNLIGMDKDNVVIEAGPISTVIPKKAIAMARLKIDF